MASPKPRPPPAHCICQDVTWQVQRAKDPLTHQKFLFLMRHSRMRERGGCGCGYERAKREASEATSEASID